MHHFRRIAVAVALLCVVGQASAQTIDASASIHKGSDYEVALPAGWVVANSAERSAIRDEVRSSFSNLKDADFSSVDVFAFDGNSAGDFATNYNVVVHGESTPLNERTLGQYASAMKSQLGQMGMVTQSVESRLDTLVNGVCLTLEMKSTFEGMRLLQRSHVFSTDSKSYILTLTTQQSEASKYASAFDDILTSFKSTQGSLKTEVDAAGVSRPLLFGIIGLVVGVGVFVLKRKA